MKKHQLGFAIVESLLVVLIAAIVGFGGYTIWHRHHKPNSPSSYTAPSPYGDWKSYTLINEKASFMFPPSWILTVADPKTPSQTDSDSVSLKAPDSFSVGISVTPNGGYGGDDSKILSADPITFIGESDFLQYKSLPVDANDFTGTIDSLQLSTSAIEKYKFPSAKKNISNSSSYGSHSEFNIYAFFAPGKGVKTTAGNQDINNLKLVIESMKY